MLVILSNHAFSELKIFIARMTIVRTSVGPLMQVDDGHGASMEGFLARDRSFISCHRRLKKEAAARNVEITRSAAAAQRGV